jgi:alpha-mannosidase
VTRLTFHLIPHTHWDREWYLPRAAFQARLVPIVDEMLDQLESEASARFVLDGQTVLLEDYLAVRPEAVERVAAAVQRGALEVGPWYVLADELIPTGESLLRNLLEGARDAARFGRRMDVLYSPDAFGHPGVMPTLAREFGIRFGVLWRGLGRPGTAGRDWYRWDGPDGSGILLYHLPPDGYTIGADLMHGGQGLERRWKAVRHALARRAATDQVAVFLGGDHHAAPRALAGLRDRLQRLEPGHDVRISGLGEFFEALKGSAKALPVLRGELRRSDGYAWVLQGVHATRARLKRRHSDAELTLLHVAEPLAALAALRGGRDRRGLLRVAWRTLVQSQFHDTLCGCASDDVAREQAVRLGSVEAFSREIATRSLWELCGHDPDAARGAGGASRLILWNPCARPRSAGTIVTAELTFFRRDVLVGPPTSLKARAGTGYRPFALEDSAGGTIPVQILAVRPGQERGDADRHFPDQDQVDRVFVVFRAPPVPALGLNALTPRSPRRPLPDEELEISDRSVANRFIAVRVSQTGVLTLEDRRTRERYPGLCLLEDESDVGDTYTFSRGPGRVIRSGRPGSRAIIARGPLVAALDARWSMPSAGKGRLGLRLLVVLHADSSVVRLRLDVENRATDHRLRVRFPVRAGDAAVAGSAFGVERRVPVRPAQPRRVLESPALTAPAHRFVAAAADARGLAVLAPGFFEYGWTRERDLVVTLLRAVGELSRENLPERPGHAGWPEPTPLAQEPGFHSIRLALVPVSQADLARPDHLSRLWEDVFLPVQTVFIRDFAAPETALPFEAVGAALDGKGLVLSAVKPPESGDGLVLRCYNATNSPAPGRWVFPRPVRRAMMLRADETELDAPRLRGDRRSVRFTAVPHQIVTMKVVLQ